MHTRLSKMLMAAAGEGGSGGGGGAGGDDKPPTLADVKKLIDDSLGENLGKAVNAAVTSQLKRLDIGNVVAEAVKAAIPAPKEEEAGAAKGGAAGALPPEVEKRLKDMDKKLADATKLAEDEKAKREAAENKSKTEERTNLLSGLLTTGNVRPNALKIALSHLSPRLVHDEDGKVKWKKDDDTLVEPTLGVTEYLKTPEGLELLPARDVGGSGAGGGKGGGGGAGGGISDGDLVTHLLG